MAISQQKHAIQYFLTDRGIGETAIMGHTSSFYQRVGTIVLSRFMVNGIQTAPGEDLGYFRLDFDALAEYVHQYSSDDPVRLPCAPN